MKIFKLIIPYLLIITSIFYLLPFIGFLYENKDITVISLLAVNPFVCFICFIIYGLKYSFNWIIPLITMILFVPAVYIYYNSSAYIYVIIYGCTALVGNIIGTVIYKIISNK